MAKKPVTKYKAKSSREIHQLNLTKTTEARADHLRSLESIEQVELSLRENLSSIHSTMLDNLRPLKVGNGSITVATWTALKAIAGQGKKGATANTISGITGILGPSLSRIIALLESDGIITATTSDKDSRSKVVKATARGIRMVARGNSYLIYSSEYSIALDSTVSKLEGMLDNYRNTGAIDPPNNRIYTRVVELIVRLRTRSKLEPSEVKNDLAHEILSYLNGVKLTLVQRNYFSHELKDLFMRLDIIIHDHLYKSFTVDDLYLARCMLVTIQEKIPYVIPGAKSCMGKIDEYCMDKLNLRDIENTVQYIRNYLPYTEKLKSTSPPISNLNQLSSVLTDIKLKTLRQLGTNNTINSTTRAIAVEACIYDVDIIIHGISEIDRIVKNIERYKEYSSRVIPTFTKKHWSE